MVQALHFGWAACLLIGASLLVWVAPARAGDDLQEEKSKSELLFQKAEKLTEDDEKDTKLKNSHRKSYTVPLTKGKVYRIDLTSKDFDTFLRLENSAGKEVAFNDDADPANNVLDSRIIYKAPASGDYRLIVTTYVKGKTGDFSLEMKLASKQEIAEAVLMEKIERFAETSPQDQKKLVQEMIQDFQTKGKKLTDKDAQIAFQLAYLIDDSQVEFARETCETFSKIFANASDKRVASVSKFLESIVKKLDSIGTEIEIAGKTTDGKDFNLKDHKGKIVLVDFWATWCGPCIAEIPNIRKAHEKYHSKGFEVIGVSLDRTDDAIVKFVKTQNLPWSSINVEDSRKLADKYEVSAIPHPILVGQDGRIVSMRARGAQLERLLARLTQEKK